MTEPKPAYDIGKLSDLERTFVGNWSLMGNGQMPAHDTRFHPTRKWRFDFCWHSASVAVECEGGIWTRGRHTRRKGFRSDVDKYNAATAMGFKIFRCTADMLRDDPYSFVEMVRKAIEGV